MPSAARSGGGRVFSSVPGGAGGDPLSATKRDLPSGLAWIPRGRFPSLKVPMASCVSPLITVRSPDHSLVTYTRTLGGGAGAGAAGAAAGALGLGASPPHDAAAAAIATAAIILARGLSRRDLP